MAHVMPGPCLKTCADAGHMAQDINQTRVLLLLLLLLLQ
jgi:hypothetical protein